MPNRRVPDALLLESYQRTASVHKTGVEVGLNHSSVHERLVRLGVARKVNEFSEAERDRLRREYLIYRDTGKLRELGASMKRTVPFLCRQARALGLTDQKRRRPWAAIWKYMSEETARVVWGSFKRQRGTVMAFCKRKRLDDLGFSRTMRAFFPDEWELEVEARAPRQTMYRFGRAFEYRVRDALRELGFFVMRSPQSKSPIDLVAIRRGAVLFVQCKRNGALGVGEWNDLLELSTSVGAVPLMAEISRVRGQILYWRLLDRKDGSKRPQPRGAFQPEHYGQGHAAAQLAEDGPAPAQGELIGAGGRA